MPIVREAQGWRWFDSHTGQEVQMDDTKLTVTEIAQGICYRAMDEVSLPISGAMGWERRSDGSVSRRRRVSFRETIAELARQETARQAAVAAEVNRQAAARPAIVYRWEPVPDAPDPEEELLLAEVRRAFRRVRRSSRTPPKDKKGWNQY